VTRIKATSCRRCHKKNIVTDKRGPIGGYKTCMQCRIYECEHRLEKERRYRASGKRAITNSRNNPRNNYNRMVNPRFPWEALNRKTRGVALFNRLIGYNLINPLTGAIQQ
jgi:hypothetical protein